MISKKLAAVVAALLALTFPVSVLASDVLDVMNTTGHFVAVEIVNTSGWRPSVKKILVAPGGHTVFQFQGWPAPYAGVTLKAVVCTEFVRTRRDPPAWATDEKIVGEKLIITDEFLRQGPPPAAPAAAATPAAKPAPLPPGEKNLTEKELGDRVSALKKALDAKEFIGRDPMKKALDEWAKSVKKNGLEFQGWNCSGPILEDYAFQVRTDWNGSRRAHQLAVKKDNRGWYVFSPVSAGY